MGFSGYACGCCVARSMFGNGEIMWVSCCQNHAYLESDSKTLSQIVDEIQKINQGEQEIPIDVG